MVRIPTSTCVSVTHFVLLANLQRYELRVWGQNRICDQSYINKASSTRTQRAKQYAYQVQVRVQRALCDTSYTPAMCAVCVHACLEYCTLRATRVLWLCRKIEFIHSCPFIRPALLILYAHNTHSICRIYGTDACVI